MADMHYWLELQFWTRALLLISSNLTLFGHKIKTFTLSVLGRANKDTFAH